MHRIIVWFFIVNIALMIAIPVYAAGILNQQMYSAEYVRTLNRQAATNAADIAAYNPAGIMQLENGSYIRTDLILGQFQVETSTPEFGAFDSETTSLCPGLFVINKKDKWAAYAAVTVAGSGGAVDYDNGNLRTFQVASSLLQSPNFSQIDGTYIEGEEVYLRSTIGGAYAVNEHVSIAVGLSYVNAKRSVEAFMDVSDPAPSTKFELDMERSADGFGGVVGIHVKFNESWDMGFRYETNTNIDLESDVKRDDLDLATQLGWADGTKTRRDLPGLLGLGVSCKITPRCKIQGSGIYFLEKEAKWEDEGYKDAGNSYELGISAEYALYPNFKVSIGYSHSEIEQKPEDFSVESPQLNFDVIGSGFTWSPTDRIDTTFGAGYVLYDSETVETINFDKDYWAISLGFQYHFPTPL
ncbi:long-chain fatty acid transport protein [Desulfosalsimonas propionicica]|uniref:Long-chain fatty acid transport protein n=1 Tax=Desulfosalsimonas propionicica TaxID=332175 RepID=A0A7W0CC77_9BACT|nr:outer membrane protein transport protein [Desulfosalsimonas propionicica]MBA2882987.1 long-chain fatty acid transport protein [Desulfosalsimonas propionicica]